MSVEFEQIRQCGRERLQQLSKPKEPKVEWWTNVGPNVMWGTQEMLWPISQEAKEATPTDRVVNLATPKKNFQTGMHAGRPLFYYSCGRPSMIWENKSNVKEASERVIDLSAPKQPSKEYTNQEVRPQYLFSCGRSSPIWTVQKGALSAGDRPRTLSLAYPRPPHREFQPSRQVETIIPGGALSASASERIHSLAIPKERPNGPFRSPQWPVSPGARNAISSTRCADLARPKATVEGYQLPRDEMWSVTRAAKRGSASGRIQELCKPLVRASMDHVQFNPDAFLVKESALKGVVPKRVEELSQPILR
ncbi:testicular haploid expressed gene protein-like [Ylistrum balloti]|uniref:testicular haploid expressed gene protein-like n=1 Tax=Ylistrum balloti TaxID=509963 RepID=UPI002905F568|nr:testicular haploid expressed gene protein-like [Ylistrum balloti]